ncbi:MAG: clostripain-related cysteine peptidase [Thermoplasmatota archaeon]|nr:hypothetical protein [Candidatus Thermoplasmatota archaeon]MBU1915168.1 hypothetical protein [Candidatus Thermoplasmatota archaeon]
MSRPQILLTAILLLPILMSPVGISSKAMKADLTVTTWTIMVYMADDATPILSWQDDVNEMEAAQQMAGTNIIALVDEYGDSNTTLLRVQQDPNGLDPTIVSWRVNDSGIVIPPSGEVNMASPDTLSAFINFSVSAYPAQRYVLILWGHGANWHGLCPDGTDIMSLPELRSALVSSTSSLGRPLDMVIIDSCAEASFEMLNQIREYTRIFVSSEKDVPFQGLPYTQVLDGLAIDTNLAPEAFGARIVDAYVDWSMVNSPYSATMGVYNLSRLEPVMNDLIALSDQGKKYDSIFHGTIMEAFEAAESYETAWAVDFGNLMDQLQRRNLPFEIRMLAIESAMSYQNMVTYFKEWSNPDPYDGITTHNATGAIIYAPNTSSVDDTYIELQLASTSWYDFGRLARHPGPTNESLPGPTITYKAGNDSIGLFGLPTELDLNWSYDYTTITAWVFRREPGGMTLLDIFSKSDKSPIVINDVFGSLVLATSAERDGVAVSYQALNATLYGQVLMEVRLVKDGEVIHQGYQVRGTVGNKSLLVRDINPTFAMVLIAPSDVDIGQMVRVEVLNGPNGEVVGNGWIVVTSNQSLTEIQVFDQPHKQAGDLVLLCLSILPGILILIFALLLLLEKGKNSSNKD